MPDLQSTDIRDRKSATEQEIQADMPNATASDLEKQEAKYCTSCESKSAFYNILKTKRIAETHSENRTEIEQLDLSECIMQKLKDGSFIVTPNNAGTTEEGA